jgi:AcrR family transcriptional regulator
MAHEHTASRKRVNRGTATIGRPSARDAILKTAIDILLDDGVEALTYEELARRSRVTKGGILYHFPNRPALNAAIQNYLRVHDLAVQEAATQALAPSSTRTLRGWAAANLGERTRFDTVGAKLITSGLWDAAEGGAHNRVVFHSLSDGAQFDRTAIVYLAVKGLWFLELGKFSPFTKAERKRLVPLLLRLADGGDIGPSASPGPPRPGAARRPVEMRSGPQPTPPAEEHNARAKILDTALEIINQSGVEALTFERLSEGAGLSKGGVLYYFPTREQLYLAVREIVRERYHLARLETEQVLPQGPGRKLKGWTIAGLNNRSQLDAVSAKIRASGVWTPPDDNAEYAARFQDIAHGVGFDRAATVYLATEGLWLLELSRSSPFSQQQRDRTVELLLELCDGSEISG